MLDLHFHPYTENNITEEVRLVIYDELSNEFIVKETIPSLESKDIKICKSYILKNLKYKYQVRNSENKWKDTEYGYNKIVELGSYDLLKILDFNNKEPLDISFLCKLDKSEVEYCFRHILLKTYGFLLGNPNESKVNTIKSYIDKFPLEFLEMFAVASHYYSLMYILTSYIQLCDYLNPNQISADKSYGYLNEIIEKYDLNNKENLGFRTGVLLAKANIISLYDRSETYKIYQEILAIGDDFVSNYLTIEALTTYYDEITVEKPTYSISYKDNGKVENSFEINLCFSADSEFFKMFALNWAQYSLYFPKLSFNFGIVTKTSEEFNSLVSNYEDLLTGLSTLIGCDIPNNTRFFFIKSSVFNKTLFACARFYLCNYILENFNGDVYITDIDQFVIGDLEKYIKNIANNELNIYQPKMRGYYSILPGRSHLAGNIFIRNHDEGRDYSKMLAEYVCMGLNEDFSWMLDQNATRFASEKFNVGNLNNLGERVLRQFPELKRTFKNAI